MKEDLNIEYICDVNRQLLSQIDDLQKENKRLHQVFDIKDAERSKLVTENKDLQKENKELRRLLDAVKSDLVGATNDYKQAQNEVNLLNKQIDRLNTANLDLSDIVETSHKVNDGLKKENADLKFRLKILNKAFLNSIYGISNVCYVDTDSIKETDNNDDNN